MSGADEAARPNGGRPVIDTSVAAVPAGSYLALSQVASDIEAEQMAEAARRYNRLARETQRHRTRAEVARFFDGLELLEPGLVPVHRGPRAIARLMPATPGTGSLATRLAALGPGLIDMHTHAIDPDLPDVGEVHAGSYPSVRRLPADRAQIILDGRVYREVDSRCWSAEARVRDMDAEGVAAQLVSAAPVTLCHGEPGPGARALAAAQNDFLARLVAQAPGRLFALGCVPLQDPGAAIEELRRCVEDLGFAGVEIGTRVGELELADRRFVPFFAAVAALRAVVFVHPVDRTLDPRLTGLGIGFGLGMPAETATAAAGLLVGDLLDAVPGLRLCLAHGGGTLPSALPRLARGQRLQGVTEPGRLATARARRLWCDSLTYDLPSLMLAAERFGPGHVVLGTDYPFDARERPAGAVLSEVAAGLGYPGVRGDLAGVARENALALLAGARAPAGGR